MSTFYNNIKTETQKFPIVAGMQTKTIRPRRTAINHKNRFFLWGKKNGLDLARYDLNSVDVVETKKKSSFKNNPEAKKHNYKFIKS